MLSWLGFGALRATPADRERAAALGPIEELEPIESAVTFVARGAQTRGALPLSTERLDAALFSSRGRGYAPYNEDGAVLFRSSSGNLYLAVFDQAGGLGGSVRGAASGLAAARVSRCFRSLAPRQLEGSAVLAELKGALEETHLALVGRGEGEVTTGVVAVVTTGGDVLLATSGDSAALRFADDGEFREMTPVHGLEGPLGAGCLTHALGLMPEGPDVHSLRWHIGPGETLVLCSDGLLDSGVDRTEIGSLLSRATTMEDGVNELAGRVLRRMSLYRAKPDNLTMVAVRRRRSPEPRGAQAGL